MEELIELVKFLFGFIPWILFLFLSGNTLVSLERSIIISLLASVVFGFRELHKGFILQWGTLLFFMACAITVNLLKSVFVAEHMAIISNGFFASLIWVTIFIGKPFTLQYAKAELPKEQWEDPGLIQSCRFIALIWALLMSLSTLISFFRILKPGLYPGWVYFNITLAIMLGGGIFTTLFKKYKRNQRNSAL
ncbi:MAG: hypothetical protein NT088_01085 [Candidatus Omnitrophica bacterium]|nr:hypothetical protein [Candidatus Omnitrophota bacterium]